LKTAIVTGAGGFIGGHMVHLLKSRGYWVRAVDIKEPEFMPSVADEFQREDLRDMDCANRMFQRPYGWPTEGEPWRVDEVYHFAADMGGMGFIEAEELALVRNNVRINMNVIQAAQEHGVRDFVFASSACVYPEQMPNERAVDESFAYPANPHNEYGWEKLFTERHLFTVGRHSKMRTYALRFQNCYGPFGEWQGGREKAPAALCRKVALAPVGAGHIEIWGDGSAVREFIHVSDLVRAVYTCVINAYTFAGRPINIGTGRRVTVKELAEIIIEVSGKSVGLDSVEGPVGVQARYHEPNSTLRGYWEPRIPLEQGLAELYEWVQAQISLQWVNENPEELPNSSPA